MAKKFAMRTVICPARAVYRRASLSGRLKKYPSVKIHFGCGEIADARFFNVDARKLEHIDYVTKSPMMPALPVLFADMIYACHVF